MTARWLSGRRIPLDRRRNNPFIQKYGAVCPSGGMAPEGFLDSAEKKALQTEMNVLRYHLFGALAQLVAHNTGSVGVRSSNLLCSTSKGPSSRMALLLVEVREPHSLPTLPGSGGGKRPATASGGCLAGLFLNRNKRAAQWAVAQIEVAEQEFKVYPILCLHDYT